MGHHIVLGAGSIGRGTAGELAAAGHTVSLVSRSGTPSDLPGVQAVNGMSPTRVG